jgi:hypothetical protein
MAPIRGSTRRTRARQDRQAALRNEFKETFGISADGHDLSQFIDHSDDDDFNEEDTDANDTQIGQRLANLRDNFNPENIRKSSKAKATFKKHQSNHERFIVHLFEKRPDLLHPEFRDSLQDTVTEIDYSDVEQRYRRYQRNGGKKSLEQRKADYRIELLRVHVADALGTPGTNPPRQTVNLELLEHNDINAFLNYITTVRKPNNGLFKSNGYTSFRSSLTYLFRLCRQCINIGITVMQLTISLRPSICKNLM